MNTTSQTPRLTLISAIFALLGLAGILAPQLHFTPTMLAIFILVGVPCSLLGLGLYALSVTREALKAPVDPAASAAGSTADAKRG